jgi:ketosteroid isomerase-like protein
VDSSRDIVKGIYAAFGKGDVPAVLGAFDAQIDWREAEGFLYEDRNPYIGPQAVAEGIFLRVVTDVDSFSVTPERFVDGGDTVVVEGRYRGTMKATGRPVDAQFAHVWELRDGKVVRFQQYTDTKQWAEASRA